MLTIALGPRARAIVLWVGIRARARDCHCTQSVLV